MRYEAELKIRIPRSWMEELMKDANKEDLSVSDIARRAVRQMLGRRAAIPRRK
jgi:hypothetical protein